MGIVDDLLDLFGDTVVVQPGVLDSSGGFVASGSTLSLPCHIEGRVELHRDPQGREISSSVQVIVAGAYDLTTHQHRYTLPSHWNPKTNLRAVAVVKASDEDGAHHEVVSIP